MVGTDWSRDGVVEKEMGKGEPAVKFWRARQEEAAGFAGKI